MHTEHDLLISKLDAFIRKFYKDRLIRGVLYSVGLLVAFFLVAALLEFFGRFGTTARTALFWGTLTAAALVVSRFIAIPLFKLFHLGSVITHEEAARIIGTHFGEVKDKLLNTLQLRDMAAARSQQRELIEAAIAQRSRELGPVTAHLDSAESGALVTASNARDDRHPDPAWRPQPTSRGGP